MPLTPGKSRSIVSNNIREMMDAGYPQKQAVAASLSNARRHPSRKGGERMARKKEHRGGRHKRR